MTTGMTIIQPILKGVDYLGTFPLFYLPSSAHMRKSQPKKTTLKRRRTAVAILLSGLERIAASLCSYGTLPVKRLKCVSDSVVAPPANQVHNCAISTLRPVSLT